MNRPKFECSFGRIFHLYTHGNPGWVFDPTERPFFEEAVAWCQVEFGLEHARWNWSPKDARSFNRFVPQITFRDPDDALAFKMRWG